MGAIPDETPVAHLDSVGAEADKWLELIRSRAATMKRVGNQHYADELMSCVERLESIKKRLKEVRKGIDKRATVVWNTELTVDTATHIRDELIDLTNLYQGNESNLDNFRVARNFVNAFIDVAARIDSLQIPQSQFEILLDGAKDELVSRFIEEEPPWDVEAVFESLVEGVRLKRKKASAEWISQVKARYSSVEELSLQEAENAVRELTSAPPYFNGEKDVAARDILIRRLEKHLESKGVDWLVEKFKQLSPSARKAFLSAIKE